MTNPRSTKTTPTTTCTPLAAAKTLIPAATARRFPSYSVAPFSNGLQLFFLQDQRAAIFLLAESEVSQLLAENLLRKFRASALYQELVDDEKLQG